MKKYLSFIFLYCVILSCDTLNDRSEANVLPHITVNGSLETHSVNLSDLMGVERIVLLETQPDALLPDVRDIEVLATNKYIIVRTLEAIYQFSSSGKFIRILSKQGNGPNEFAGITGFSVDSNNELLFYSHSRDPNHVVVINLDSGYQQPRILIPIDFEETGDKLGMVISSLTVDSIQNITCLMSPHTKCKYSVFSMTPIGELRWFIERPEEYSLTFEDGYYSSIGLENHYKEPKNDTLYLLDNSGKRKPILIFDIADYHESIKKRTIHGELPNETKWGIGYEGFNYFIINRMAVHRYTGGAWSPLDAQYVLILKNEKPFIIDNLFVDEFGFEQISAKSPLPIDFDGEVLIYKMNSVEFKKKAEKALGNVNKKVERLLKELHNRLSENDNPILLIGTAK